MLHHVCSPERIVEIDDMTKAIDGWRVVYGESRPAWEKVFLTRREARAFAKEHRSFGDIIFSIKVVVPGERPRSIMAAIEAMDETS